MTAIEWTHPPGFRGESWNPFVGCSIVSKGCTNCYAMKMASRIIAMQGEASHYAETVKTVKGKPVWTGAIREASEKVWTAPLRAREPRCYFVNSMGDVFHEDVPEMGESLACFCPLDAPCHADVLLELANPDEGDCAAHNPLASIHLSCMFNS